MPVRVDSLTANWLVFQINSIYVYFIDQNRHLHHNKWIIVWHFEVGSKY